MIIYIDETYINKIKDQTRIFTYKIGSRKIKHDWMYVVVRNDGQIVATFKSINECEKIIKFLLESFDNGVNQSRKQES